MRCTGRLGLPNHSSPCRSPRPHRPFTLTPKPSMASNSAQNTNLIHPPHSTTQQYHWRAVDNCWTIAATSQPNTIHHSHPPSRHNPGPFPSSSSRFIPFYPHSFHASFWANIERIELFPPVFLDHHPSLGSVQVWSPSGTSPRGCLGLCPTRELDTAVTLNLPQAPDKDIPTV